MTIESGAIYKSTKEKRHTHLIYTKVEVVNDLNGQRLEKFTGNTSTNNGHKHDIIFDEVGNATLLPAGKVAHTHDANGEMIYEGESLPTDESEQEIVSNSKKMIEETRDIEKDSFTMGEESERFYAGKQWTDSDKAKLQAEDRPAITINEIAPKIDLLCGFQRQNRTDIRFFPIENSDNTVSHVSTEVTKNIMERNNFHISETEVFKDQATVGRGVYHFYVDYDKNMLGDIVLERMSWRDVHFGPHSKSDLSDCEYIVKTKSYPKKKLKLMYPDKKKEIDSLYQQAEDWESRSGIHQTIAGQEYNIPDNLRSIKNAVDLHSKHITVYEIWEKYYTTVYSVVNYDDGYVSTVDGLSKSDINDLEDMGFDVITRTTHQMRVTTIAAQLLLDDRLEAQDFFPVLPVYAKRDFEGNFYGKVEEVKDPQREVNKRHSQSLDVINKVSSYGYYYDDQTFDSPREETQWRRDVSKPGFTAKVKDRNNIPIQTQGTRMPTELVGLQDLASQKIREIMNISPEALGFSEREVSSVAIIEKRRNVLTANEFLYDNLAMAKKQISKYILKMIQLVYTPERVLRIVSNPNVQTEEDQFKNQQLAEAANTLINTASIEDLDVAVEVSSSAPTTRSANFSLLLEMIRFGMQIPPDVLINASDLPNKDEILGTIKASAEAKAKAEQAKNDTEIQKTVIANSDNQTAQQVQGLPPQQQF